MDEKIKAILGEQAAELETKLKQAGIDIGITNNGTWVPAAKHDSLKDDLKIIQDKLSANDGDTSLKSAELLDMKTELKTATDAFEQYKTDAERDKVKQSRVKSLEKSLRSAKMNPEIIDMFIKSTDLEKVKYSDNGEVTDDYITSIKDSKKSLFGAESTDSQKTKDDNKGNDSVNYTSEEIDKMSMDEVRKNLPDVLKSMENKE